MASGALRALDGTRRGVVLAGLGPRGIVQATARILQKKHTQLLLPHDPFIVSLVGSRHEDCLSLHNGSSAHLHFLSKIRDNMVTMPGKERDSSQPRRTGQRPSSMRIAGTLLSLMIVVAACGLPRTETSPDSASDSTSVVDSSMVAAAGPDSTLATADSGATRPALLDSLLWQVAQLESMLVDLRRADRIESRGQEQRRGEQIREDVSNFGLRAFWAIVVITIAFFLIKFISWLLETLSERSAKRRLFFKKLIPISRILVWIIVVYYVVAGVFQVDQEGLLAAGAAVGVAIGFAAQDVLKNIFGGILIIMDQPFQVGDRVSVGGTYGEVVSIGLRSTRIVTPDDNLVSVPNTQVVDGQVANANAGALDCQVVTNLFLPGRVDVSRAKEIAYDAAANSKYVFLKKPIVVLVKDEFRETFLTKIVVKAYVLDARYEAAFASDITETAKSQYLREGMLADFIPGSYHRVTVDDEEETA